MSQDNQDPTPPTESVEEMLERYKREKTRLREALIENGIRAVDTYRMTLEDMRRVASRLGLF